MLINVSQKTALVELLIKESLERIRRADTAAVLTIRRRRRRLLGGRRWVVGKNKSRRFLRGAIERIARIDLRGVEVHEVLRSERHGHDLLEVERRVQARSSKEGEAVLHRWGTPICWLLLPERRSSQEVLCPTHLQWWCLVALRRRWCFLLAWCHLRLGSGCLLCIPCQGLLVDFLQDTCKCPHLGPLLFHQLAATQAVHEARTQPNPLHQW